MYWTLSQESWYVLDSDGMNYLTFRFTLEKCYCFVTMDFITFVVKAYHSLLKGVFTLVWRHFGDPWNYIPFCIKVIQQCIYCMSPYCFFFSMGYNYLFTEKKQKKHWFFFQKHVNSYSCCLFFYVRILIQPYTHDTG